MGVSREGLAGYLEGRKGAKTQRGHLTGKRLGRTAAAMTRAYLRLRASNWRQREAMVILGDTGGTFFYSPVISGYFQSFGFTWMDRMHRIGVLIWIFVGWSEL